MLLIPRSPVFFIIFGQITEASVIAFVLFHFTLSSKSELPLIVVPVVFQKVCLSYVMELSRGIFRSFRSSSATVCAACAVGWTENNVVLEDKMDMITSANILYE